MTSIRLCKAVALCLLISSAVYADIHDRIEYKLQRVLKDLDIIINGDASLCTPINQLEIDQGGGSFLVTHSGLFCVTEDVVGTVVIDSGIDCVCIDLGCHTLDAGGAGNAIVGGGNQGLKVFNGCITNSSDAAISLLDYSVVELYNLHFHDYVGDGVRAVDSSLLSLHDLDFNNEDEAERAVLFEGVDTVAVNRTNATGFLSTVGAVIQFDDSTNISLSDVNVTNCTKTLVDPVGGFPAFYSVVAARLVSLEDSSNYDLTRVKVNNNTGDSDLETNFFAAIGVGSSHNGSFNQCQTNNNSVVTNGSWGFTGLLAESSDNVVVNGHQANANRCEVASVTLLGIQGLSSDNMVIDGCQANDNFVAVMLPDSLAGAAVCGISIGLGSNGVIRNSQANSNRVDDAGTPLPGTEHFCGGFTITSEGAVMDNCQANDNSMADSQAFGACVCGLHSHIGPVVSNSTFNNNIGGERGIGIWRETAVTGFEFDASDFKVINCTANGNSGFGFYLGGIVLAGLGTGDRIEIIDSTFNNNGRETSGDAAGINFTTLDQNVTDVVIKGCVINGTFADAGDAAGINVPNASNVVIEDTIVNHTTADGVGHGILFDTVNSSKILRCQFHENQDIGVELQGDNDTIALIECVAMFNDIGFDFAVSSTATCCLVQDCRAISNLSNGFVHGTGPLTTTFIGNEAHCNGDLVTDNYDINGGVINLQELDWTNGDFTQISGSNTTALGAHFTNLQAAGV